MDVRRLLDIGPAGLVPLAWVFTLLAHRGLVGLRSLQIAHAVMLALLIAFVIAGWRAMATGALAVWRGIIVIGIPVTAAGLFGFIGDVPILHAISLYGWMILPALGLIYTGRQQPLSTAVYVGGGSLSLFGAGVYAVLGAGGPWTLAGIGLVGLGQTLGIVDAAFRH